MPFIGIGLTNIRIPGDPQATEPFDTTPEKLIEVGGAMTEEWKNEREKLLEALKPLLDANALIAPDAKTTIPGSTIEIVLRDDAKPSYTKQYRLARLQEEAVDK